MLHLAVRMPFLSFSVLRYDLNDLEPGDLGDELVRQSITITTANNNEKNNESTVESIDHPDVLQSSRLSVSLDEVQQEEILATNA